MVSRVLLYSTSCLSLLSCCQRLFLAVAALSATSTNVKFSVLVVMLSCCWFFTIYLEEKFRLKKLNFTRKKRTTRSFFKGNLLRYYFSATVSVSAVTGVKRIALTLAVDSLWLRNCAKRLI